MLGPRGPHHLPLVACTFAQCCAKNDYLALQQTSLVNFSTRGWVEAIRVEAKAKDTKNARPRTALPRIDPLEAKDRNARGQDQGHRSKYSSKKGLKNVFSGDLKKKSSNNFSGDLQNFNNSKNSAVLEPRTGQLSRSWGFEAKAKDFKMCPQGRPRGLHLCFPLSFVIG